MRRVVILMVLFAAAVFSLRAQARHVAATQHSQDTGFLNRKVICAGNTYKYTVYLPEEYDLHRKWPVILFLHGSGERGSEGMMESQVGLAAAVRSHPERWPFVIVMPQVPWTEHYWTDPDMQAMAIATLDATMHEFHGDPDRVYLTGLSMGGHGTWELARNYPGRWAAIVPVASSIRWGWAPAARTADPNLPDAYVAAIGKTPVWIFHGADDHTVPTAQGEKMYQALKAGGGNVRFTEYEHVGHDSWDPAYAEPDLPRWLLSHTLHQVAEETAFAERRLVPIHPVPIRLDAATLDSYTGEYSFGGNLRFTVVHVADHLELCQRTSTNVMLAETATTFFGENGGTTRVIFNKDTSGRVVSLTYKDDRHQETFLKTR